MSDLRIYKKIILMLSVFAFCLLLPSEASYYHLAIKGIMGLCGAAIIWFKKIKHRKTHLIIPILSALLSVLILLLMYDLFIATWNGSSLIGRIASTFGLSFNAFLFICYVVMAILSLPFLSFIINRIICLMLYCFKGFKEEAIKACKPGKLFKTIGFIILNLAIAATVGVFLLIGVYHMPTAEIDKNVQKSASIFEKEGSYPSVFSWCTSQLDNFTDAIMFLEAANDSQNTAVNKAMMVYRGSFTGTNNPARALVAHYIDGMEFDENVSYPRYWHGYEVLIKPLLSVTDYSTIRVINGVIQVLSVFAVSLLMFRRRVPELILPYCLSYLMLMPIALAKSLQFSSCFYIITVGMIVLLSFKKTTLTSLPPPHTGRSDCTVVHQSCKWKNFIFLNLGILTAYFDFLTYPIATLGVPCVLYLYLERDEGLEKKLFRILTVTVFWGLGYAGMWASKWIIGSVITKTDIVSNALNQFTVYTSNSYSDTHNYILAVILKNFSDFICTPITILCGLFCACLIARIMKKKQISNQTICKIMIPYILIAIYPFLWYAFARNHSSIHYWFTNKACVVTLSAILFGLIEVWIRNQKEEKGEIHG